jgi:hypothetical protein
MDGITWMHALVVEHAPPGWAELSPEATLLAWAHQSLEFFSAAVQIFEDLAAEDSLRVPRACTGPGAGSELTRGPLVAASRAARRNHVETTADALGSALRVPALR